MASGRLGTARPTAETETVVYTVPEATVATVNINCVNTGATAATIKIALSTTDAPVAGEYFEMASLQANGGVVERTGIMMSAGERVVAWATLGTVDVRVHGIEEDS